MFQTVNLIQAFSSPNMAVTCREQQSKGVLFSTKIYAPCPRLQSACFFAVITAFVMPTTTTDLDAEILLQKETRDQGLHKPAAFKMARHI